MRRILYSCLPALMLFASISLAQQEPAEPEYEIRLEIDSRVPMRDGSHLSADVYRPKANGRFPVILVMTPYDNASQWPVSVAKYFVPRGYVAVLVDTRGSFDSEGEAYMYNFHGPDVYDTNMWIGAQPWSDGKIGTIGGSSLAYVQWVGAVTGPPGLACMVPLVSPDDHYDNVFPSGAFQLSNSLSLLLSNGGQPVLGRTLTDAGIYDWDRIYRHLPLKTTDDLLVGRKSRFYQDWIAHPTNDEYWRFGPGDRLGPGKMGPGQYDKVNVPTLNISGWYDQVSQATINNYLGMVEYGPPSLKNKHRLIMGPWPHGVPTTESTKAGPVDFGPSAGLDTMKTALRWFDECLKGRDIGVMNEPPVQIFVMGENVWRNESEWPLKRAQYTKYFLRSTGPANSLFGKGTLSTSSPGEEQPDRYTYNPDDPVPTLGGNANMRPSTRGAVDQRSVQVRYDVLVYTSDSLAEAVEVTGPIHVVLYASSSAPDTDFTGKLFDVHPNGQAVILTEGIVRARLRNSFKKEELINPGEIYQYTIDLWSTSNVFKKGHRIGLEISSSNFPKYDRNPNTGHPFGQDAELRPADQIIYHDAERPSHVVLPVIPR